MNSNPEKGASSITMFVMVFLIVCAACSGCGDMGTYYKDSDGDGYGDPDQVKRAINQPPGYVTNSKDCNDSDAAVSPEATELCNDGIDNDCDENTDGDDSDCPLSLLPGGRFTVCSWHGIRTGLGWNVDSTTFDCELDGIDTMLVDINRDGYFTDESHTYEVDADGSMRIANGLEGIFSHDQNVLALTLADIGDQLDFSVFLREGTGMSTDTFDGLYLITKFEVNKSTDVAHTYVIAAEKTGYGLGLFRVTHSSNPAAVDFTSPFTYSIEENGNIEFVDSREEGKISEDGTFFVAADVDPRNNIETIMIALKVTSGLTNSILQGEYIVNLAGRNIVSGAYWAARILATFDGVGIVRYRFLDHTALGGGLTGYMYYLVRGSLLAIGAPTGTVAFGTASSDGSRFSVVDIDTRDGQIYIMTGIKRH